MFIRGLLDTVFINPARVVVSVFTAYAAADL